MKRFWLCGMEGSSVRLDQQGAVTLLEALGQELRLEIWRLIATNGPEGITAGRIAEQLSIAPSSLSFHLQHLRQAGLVTGRRSSRYVVYAAAHAPLQGLVTFLAECGRTRGQPMVTRPPACDDSESKPAQPEL